MILHDIADGAGFLIELTAAVHAHLLGHRDLHAGDVIAIPDGLEERVGKAEIQQTLHRLLAEVVIDPKDARLGKALEQDLVERFRGLQVPPEGLLDHHPHPRGHRVTEVLDDHRKNTRRNRKVIQRTLSVAQRLAQRVERGALAIVAVHILQQAEEARDHVLGALRHELLHALAHVRDKLFLFPAGPCHADHGHRQQASFHEVI